MKRGSRIGYLVIWLLFTVAYASPVQGLSVDVGPLAIMDNDPLFDSDPRTGIISFNVFVMPQGYQIAGTATQFSNGTFTQLATSAEVDLAVTATRPGNVGNGAPILLIVEGPFAGNFSPPSPVTGVDIVQGNFVSVVNNNLGGGNDIAEQGFINDMRINPLMSTGMDGPFAFSPLANVPGQPFGPDGHGPMGFAFPIANASTLTGQARFNLGAFDQLNFSMQVATMPVPQPSALL